jgi:uncharacterized protein
VFEAPAGFVVPRCYTAGVNFEWEEGKAGANFAKHGVSFEEAQTVFDDPLYVDFYDPEHSFDEHRYIIVGESREGRLLIAPTRREPMSSA